MKSYALAALSEVYGGIVTARNLLFDAGILRTAAANLPVICVGNAALGGSGKTPLTQYLAEHLQKRGKRPAVLLRGYRGEEAGPLLVQADMPAEKVGDEALEHVMRLGPGVPVVVSRSRVAGAAFIESRTAANIILMDDGFQHRYLRRNSNLLLLDITSLEADPLYLRMAPLGRLREPLDPALQRSSAVVLISRGERKPVPPTLLSRIDKKPFFEAVLKASIFSDGYSGRTVPLESLRGAHGSALTAVARPKPFFDMLSASGIHLSAERSYADHHVFSADEWHEALKSGEDLVFCTAKDLVKLRRFVSAEGRLQVLQLELEFISGEQESTFWRMLEEDCLKPAR